jgi:hypothetical protein
MQFHHSQHIAPAGRNWCLVPNKPLTAFLDKLTLKSLASDNKEESNGDKTIQHDDACGFGRIFVLVSLTAIGIVGRFFQSEKDSMSNGRRFQYCCPSSCLDKPWSPSASVAFSSQITKILRVRRPYVKGFATSASFIPCHIVFRAAKQ